MLSISKGVALLELPQRISEEVCEKPFAMSDTKFINSKLCAMLPTDTLDPNGLHFNRFG